MSQPSSSPPPFRVVEPAEPASRRTAGRTQRLAVAAAALLALGLGVGWLASYLMQPARPLHDATAVARPVTPRGDLPSDEQQTIDTFRKRSRSVVFITTTALRRDRFNFNPVEIPQGTGTGFVWDEAGHVVTNFHVISGAASRNSRIRVMLADQTTHSAKVIGVAPDNDLAVLRIDNSAANLEALPLGSSSDLEVGQKVLAIGNPFGLDQTLTTGVISGLGREIAADSGRAISDVIQTDAAINPGNSGGPLLDSAGRLIGVNTAIYSPSGAYAGIGFAIPVDTVNRVVPQLLRHGKVIRPGFGIQIANDQIVRQLGIEGVLVLRVQPGGAAEAAGFRATEMDEEQNIQLGDVIVGVDGRPIRDSNDLFKALDRRAVGDEVSVTLLRHAKTPSQRQVELTATLKALD